MIALLIESAGRSLLLFLAVFAFLRVFQIRSEHTQLIVWRTALAAAFSMPLLLQARIASIPVDAELDLEFLTVSGFSQAQSTGSLIANASIAYALITLFLAVRYAAGLIASWRMHRNSTQTEGKTWPNLKVRVSASIVAPATVGSTVLLPAEFTTWSSYKLRATLAHEAAHVRNGDFYWRAAALLYRAIFWINPFAWWLPRRMSRLSESLCDGSAVHSVGDPLAYAEVLVAFANRQLPITLSSPLTVDMARSTDVESRVAQLLKGEIQSHTARRSGRTMCCAVLIAITTVGACTSCEEQANTQAASAPSATTQEEVIVEPRVNPNQTLSFPDYVDSEKKAGHQGVVYLAILIDTDGRVAKSRIKKSSGFEPLDRVAEAHARGYWRLIPATKNGIPVERWVTIPVKFKLRENDGQPDA